MSGHLLKGNDGFHKRGKEVFMVYPRSIVVVNGWNERTDFSHVPDLKKSIKERGVEDPIILRKTKEGELHLVDGECRLRATLMAMDEGTPIKSIPAFVNNSRVSEIELFTQSAVANTGTPLNPPDEANNFKKFMKYGFSVKEIAKTVGKSETHVRGRLKLSDAGPAVKQAVAKKEITIAQAQDIVDTSDGKIEAQADKLEEVMATPKKERVKKPAARQYGKYEFCESMGCPHFSKGDEFLEVSDRCETLNLKTCIYSAKEFHHWLKENDFKIVKGGQIG